MSLRRWEPLTGLARLREEMDRWFEDFFPVRRAEEGLGVRLPAVDVVETDEHVVVKAELPGVDKKGLDVEALPDSLVIKAETAAEQESQRGDYFRRERRWGAFERVVPLPVEVKPAEAKARLQDGVLEVTLPKAEVSKPREPTKVSVENAK